MIQAYRETCAAVIRRFEGQPTNYSGDGLLVYFGSPAVVATLPPQEQDQAREP